MKKIVALIISVLLCVSMVGCATSKTSDNKLAEGEGSYVKFDFEDGSGVRLSTKAESKYVVSENKTDGVAGFFVKEGTHTVSGGAVVALKSPLKTDPATCGYNLGDVFEEDALKEFKILKQGTDKYSNYYYIYLTKGDNGEDTCAVMLNLTNRPVMVLYTTFEKDAIILCEELVNEIGIKYTVAE